jgi:hypothetical protein
MIGLNRRICLRRLVLGFHVSEAEDVVEVQGEFLDDSMAAAAAGACSRDGANLRENVRRQEPVGNFF